MFIWSMAFGVLPPLMQTQLLREATAGLQDAANAVYTATFSVGIGGGALVGALSYGVLGVGALPWVDIGLLLVSAMLVVVTSGTSMLAARRSRPGDTAVAGGFDGL